LSKLRSTNSGVSIDVVDIYSRTLSVVGDPGAYGFTDVTDAGIDAGPDANLSHYLFWDDEHPTTAGHTLIAAAAYSAAVPEPGGFTLACLCLGVCGWRMRRRRTTA
jgi:phospholipase/lecithinase/hemolysin